MSNARFKGEAVDLGGVQYVLPPMSLGSVERFHARIDAYLGKTETQPVGLMIDVIHSALLRNYPDLTREQVAEMVDISNVGQVFNKLLMQSGWAPTAGGDEPGGIEGNPQASASPGTGSASSPT
jgi:hypothetical protein